MLYQLSYVPNKGTIPQNIFANKGRFSCYKRTGLPRISPADAADIAYDLARLPIATDLLPDTEIRSRIQQLALYHNLSYYDASYLELSHRTGFSLKTFDQALLKATKI